jgi:hypothetical protein
VFPSLVRRFPRGAESGNGMNTLIGVCTDFALTRLCPCVGVAWR